MKFGDEWKNKRMNDGWMGSEYTHTAGVCIYVYLLEYQMSPIDLV